MQLNIEEQIPIQTKIYKQNTVFIPSSVRKALGINFGDDLELYATTKGIFIRKTGE